MEGPSARRPGMAHYVRRAQGIAMQAEGPRLPIEDFLELDAPIVDVRSPGEYQQGHIPGAHNLPLFTDAERAAVGTTY